MPEEKKKPSSSDQPASELSEVWLELLGRLPESETATASAESDATIPVLQTDPWNDLLHVRGVEEIDLQHAQLQVSDQEVEQVLQMMQEQETNPPKPKKNS